MDESNNLNIDDYSIDDLQELFDLHHDFDDDDVNNSLIDLLKKYSALGEEKYMHFLKNAREKLIKYIEIRNMDNNQNDNLSENNNDDVDSIVDDNINSTELYTKEYLKDVNLLNQVVNRKNNVDITDKDKHFIYTRNREPIVQGHNVPFVQGQVNPTLRNINKSIVSLDSQMRQNLTSDTNNITYDLSEPLIDVMALRVMSVEIKHCWYTFDKSYGTTDFLIDNTLFQIPDGNYSYTELMNTINSELSSHNFSFIIFSYNSNTGKTQILNRDMTPHTISFYNNETPGVKKKNSNFGWLLGFKTFDTSYNIQYTIQASQTIFSSGLLDVYGPRYILLELDDYNNNHYNRNYISVDDTQEMMKYPSYYTPDISLNDPTKRFTRDNNGNVVWVDSGLKQTQVFTILQVNESRQQKGEGFNKITSTRKNDIIAKLPVQYSSNFGTLIIGYNFINKNERLYYGPVNIKRMRIALYNDAGQLLNLNKQDFSITLQADELYQY